MHKLLNILLEKLAVAIGHPYAFLVMTTTVIVWFAVGFFMDFSNTWFDIMDVSIFLSTFLFVFIIQHSQNADTKAIQEKLDELIKKLPKARNSKAGIEKRLKKNQ